MSLFIDTPAKLAGKKRKRSMEVEDDPHLKLTGKLHHYLKEMRKAAKKSKAFETQRLVKKLKNHRRPNYVGMEDIKDLETQLESLKRTDHERIAHLSLSSKIRKDKALSSNNDLMTSMASAISTSTNANTDSRNGKVESRLLSSKILAAAAQEAVKGLRAVFEPVMTAKSHSTVRNAESAISDQERGDEELDKIVAGDIRPVMNSAEDDSSNEEDTEGTSIAGQELNEADDTVDHDGWESGSIDDIEPAGSDDNDLNESRSSGKKAKHTSSSSLLRPLDPSSSAVASTFLPSLSVGYIRGESESDIDPSDGETTANGRKNRRGQRARQAIWEKKYGRSAKHLKKQREDVQAMATAQLLGKRPDKGWDGRQHGDSESPSVSIRPAKKKRQAPSVQTHSRGQHEMHLPSEKPTHPSWEAKRKLKEKEGARILPSQGKKIVFT